MKLLGVITTGFVTMVIAMIIGSLAMGIFLAPAWNLVIVPLGLPEITVKQAMGLALLIALIKGVPTEKDDTWEERLIAILMPLFIYIVIIILF